MKKKKSRSKPASTAKRKGAASSRKSTAKRGKAPQGAARKSVHDAAGSSLDEVLRWVTTHWDNDAVSWSLSEDEMASTTSHSKTLMHEYRSWWERVAECYGRCPASPSSLFIDWQQYCLGIDGPEPWGIKELLEKGAPAADEELVGEFILRIVEEALWLEYISQIVDRCVSGSPSYGSLLKLCKQNSCPLVHFRTKDRLQTLSRWADEIYPDWEDRVHTPTFVSPDAITVIEQDTRFRAVAKNHEWLYVKATTLLEGRLPAPLHKLMEDARQVNAFAKVDPNWPEEYFKDLRRYGE